MNHGRSIAATDLLIESDREKLTISFEISDKVEK
jgi:hypothetical protein